MFANMITSFFPKKYRKDIRKILVLKGTNSDQSNKIIVIENGLERELKNNESVPGLDIIFTGKNNLVKIYYPTSIQSSAITIGGENNLVCIKETRYLINGLNIAVDYNTCYRKILIDKNFSCNGAIIQVRGNNKTVEIGEDCMFSYGIDIMNGDHHKVFESEGQLIEMYKDKKIGKHVWLASNCKILKNADIQDGCIIGAGSVVTKTFKEKNAVIAGNPAKVVKRNIRWER